MKRTLLTVLLTIILLFSLGAVAQDTNKVAPRIFAGWQLQKVDKSLDPAKADPVYADLLREYGLAEVENAQYTKYGRNILVKVARFKDASGAFGAYTFYRTPEMAAEDIGDLAASNFERILFLRGNLLVDVKMDRITPMTGGELRELGSALPKESGNAANLPTITNYLPKQGLVPYTTKYVSGPFGLARVEPQLPSEQVDFSTGAEVATAQYKTGQGTANLLLISYPTPAVAGVHLRTLEQWRPSPAPGTTAAAPAAWTKRTGPLVAMITGSISDGEAKTLLASVNYDADVTWNQNTGFNLKNNIGNLLFNIILLVAMLIALAVVAGFAFGGTRILLRKLFPNHDFDRNREAEIIRLNIGK
jgi:Family of unknown function (DUF6599)